MNERWHAETVDFWFNYPCGMCQVR